MRLFFTVALITLLIGCSHSGGQRTSSHTTNNQQRTTITPSYSRPITSYYCNAANYSPQDCQVPALGSLKESVSSRNGQVYTTWASNCGCFGGIPHGMGAATWCKEKFNCNHSNKQNFLGQISGAINMGRYVGPVKINSFLGQYSGSVTNAGDYYKGILISIRNNEKFIGEFNQDGTYKSGTLYKDEKIIVSDTFQNNQAIGRTIVSDRSGNFSTYVCETNYNCTFQTSGKDQGLAFLGEILKEIVVGAITERIERLIKLAIPLLATNPYSGILSIAINVTIFTIEMMIEFKSTNIILKSSHGIAALILEQTPQRTLVIHIN